MQAGNARGLFQDLAALGGLGGDDAADLPLLHQRRRMGAGGGIGKEGLHVTRAGIGAIDAIGRPHLTLDAARHLDHVFIIVGGRRGTAGIVDRQHHFGHVAGRAAGRAGEDDIVHAGGAHGLVGAFAHHPAQRFQQVGLAAAIGPDHTRQPALDHEFGGFDEGLEAGQAEAVQFQGVSHSGRPECPRMGTHDLPGLPPAGATVPAGTVAESEHGRSLKVC